MLTDRYHWSDASGKVRRAREVEEAMGRGEEGNREDALLGATGARADEREPNEQISELFFLAQNFV